MGKLLKDKPLVEALLELRWDIPPMESGDLPSHFFPIFLGRFHERLKTRYSFVERLDVADLPDQMVQHVVKFRFRPERDCWPLVQTGPGVATINYTESYEWETFRDEVLQIHEKLLAAYGDADHGPRFTQLLLRYINALPIEGDSSGLLELLRDKFHFGIALPPDVTHDVVVAGPCRALHLRAHLPLKSPQGVGVIQIASGQAKGKPAIIWEIHVLSAEDAVPQDRQQFETWLQASHDVAERWFFAIIAGDLERQFEGSRDV
jgi:uncharacterized protein (TIGR04255 family)